MTSLLLDRAVPRAMDHAVLTIVMLVLFLPRVINGTLRIFLVLIFSGSAESAYFQFDNWR